MEPEKGYYYHFKHTDDSINNFAYRVFGVSYHSESQEPLVIYKALYGDNKMWARPLDMFMDEVEKDNYNGPRFKKIEDEELIGQLKEYDK